jgi:hypothetical protein
LERFPTENTCFINKNYEILQKHTEGAVPIAEQESLKVMEEIQFGPLARFFRLQYR